MPHPGEEGARPLIGDKQHGPGGIREALACLHRPRPRRRPRLGRPPCPEGRLCKEGVRSLCPKGPHATRWQRPLNYYSLDGHRLQLLGLHRSEKLKGFSCFVSSIENGDHTSCRCRDTSDCRIVIDATGNTAALSILLLPHW